MNIDWGAVLYGLGLLLTFLLALDARKNKHERKAAKDEDDASAGESASAAVKVLLDPLTARIRILEAQVEALQNRELILVKERDERETRHAKELGNVREQMTEKLETLEAKRRSEAEQAEIQRLKMEADLAVLRSENATLKARVAELERKIPKSNSG